MRGVAHIASLAVALLVSGAATLAYADPHAQTTQTAPTQSTTPQPNFTGDVDPTGPWSIKPDHHTFQLGAGNRWGLKLDMEQPLGRDMAWKDVKAGAFVKLTPNIRVGGTVGLGDKLAQPQKVTPEDTQPRVHLETAFKF